MNADEFRLIIVSFAFCVLAASSFLTLWFRYHLKCTLLRFLRWASRSRPEAFWPVESTLTPEEWNTWLVLRSFKGQLPAWLVDLLNCPGCLSVHACFWSGALCLPWLCSSFGIWSAAWPFLCSAAAPILVLKLHHSKDA